ncbi:ComEA family DNA-binding protein [Streptomyces lycii]|uniref:ComEA family DNA-binding protein n=1 Tax=Streptomyces lycii TaxID=2654337 RepID=UPI001F238A44|nr:ComEA family DNA-binding protein [Streptomyces lycii]
MPGDPARPFAPAGPTGPGSPSGPGHAPAPEHSSVPRRPSGPERRVEPASSPDPASSRDPVRLLGSARRATVRPERTAAHSDPPEPDAPRAEPVEPDPAGAPAPASAAAARRLPWHTRWRLGLRERLPLWVQLRCGIEPRTLAALTVLLVLAAGLAVHHYWTGRPETVRSPSAEPAAPSAPEQGPSPGAPAGPAAAHGAGRTAPRGAARTVVVDVTGKVGDPGVHRLPTGSRVEDALRAAGGVRPGTDTGALNRARVLVDGEQIVVGGPPGAPGAGGTAGSPGAGVPSGTGPAAGPVSLNSATSEQLETLPGVGPVLAQHIIDYRTQQGGFTSVDQLREVNGIGDRRFADIQPLVQP